MERFLSPSDHSAEAIIARFAQAPRTLSTDRATALAREIAAYGGLEEAIAALAHDDAFRALNDALAYRALLAQTDNPKLRIARLLAEAADLDARAAPAWAEAADWRGRAAYRRARGEVDLAAQFHSRALAAEHVAADYEEQAFQRRLQAAELKADGVFYEALRAVAA